MSPVPRSPVSLGLSLDRTVAVLRAAGETTRLRILLLLTEGDLTVTDLTTILVQSQPRISRHLKLLGEAGLIERYQEGSWAYFRLAPELGRSVMRDLAGRIDADDPDLARDRERRERVRVEQAEAAGAYFAAVAQDWDRIRALHAPEEEVERAMLDLVGETPVQSMLDLGTGTGRMLELFAPLYREGLGLDASREMLGVARAKLAGAGLAHARVRRADILNADAPLGAFDLVTMHQVLHVLDAPARALHEAARFVAPGGRLLVVDFAPHAHEFLRQDQAHRRLGFAAAQVAEWLGEAGLAMEAVREVPADDPDGLTVLLWLARDPRLLIA